MQTFTVAFQAELDKGQIEPRLLIDVYEFYPSTYVPASGEGFDPAEATQRFASAEIEWNGLTYDRQVISRGDISRSMTQESNSVNLTFSNIDRFMSTLAQTNALEGMFLAIRCIVPAVTDDSAVLFVGRLGKPSTITKKTFSIEGRQDFGNINQSLPPSKFVAQDPDGRLPTDPLFEGIRFVALAGSFTFVTVEPSSGLLGRLFGRRRDVFHSQQWSSVDGTPYGQAIPEVFGRCQMQFIPFMWADTGPHVKYMMAACRGPISGMDNIKCRTAGFSDPFTLPGPTGPTIHLGDPGNTGTNLGSVQFPTAGYFSGLAYIEGASEGSAMDVVDGPPTITGIIRGRAVPVPNSSGVFSSTAWSDNPVNITRFIMTTAKWVGIDPGFMEDSVNYLTSLHCDEPLIDETNDQMILIPNPQLVDAGETFRRFNATGIYTARWWRHNYLGDTSIIPEFEDGDYTGVDLDNIPTSYATQKLLRKRYTASFPITDDVRAVDLLYKQVFPSFKGFLRVNKNGKYEIRSEQPSDATRLRSATAVGATSIPILDVTPWKTGPDLLKGRLLLGFSLTTSEVRNVSSADYSTSGNSVTLAASATGGGVTATPSGATLTLGSTTVQASGTVTIGGTPAAGNVATVTIDGIAVAYTLGADDTTGTVAAMLKSYINATPRLKTYIKAFWDAATPTVLTIKCLHGALNLNTALLKAHSGPIADPAIAPTVAASAGALTAGTYKVAYADVFQLQASPQVSGSTALTPIASVVLTANQQIDVSALPAFPGGVISRNFYISENPDSTNLRYVANRTNTSTFSINSLPLAGAAHPPSYNKTAEELLRVAMSLATNSQDVLPAWSSAITPTLNDIYLPTVLNGHKYKATTVAGATGASEPTWPLTSGGTVVDGGVTWTEFGETVMGQAGLTRANVLKDSYNWPLGSAQSSTNQIKIAFRDAVNDFALTPYRVNDPIHQAQVGKAFPLEIDGQAIDNFHQMYRIANWALAKHRDGDWFNTMGTGPQGLCLEEGDVICSSDDSGGLVNVVTRAEKIRITPQHHVIIEQARRYSSNMFSDDAEREVIPLPTVLDLTSPRPVTDIIVAFNDDNDLIASATAHPKPSEEPAECVMEVWDEDYENLVTTVEMKTLTARPVTLTFANEIVITP